MRPAPARVTASTRAARRAFPGAVWVSGSGPWASVARCNGSTSVALYATSAEATRARAFIDRMGCGGGCTRDHEVKRVTS